jgi:hypothetical protein
MDTHVQKQMSELSYENHMNPIWGPNSSFDLCVSSDMLHIGHNYEQMIKMSIWQKIDNDSSQELCFHTISVREFHEIYHSIPETTEIIFPLLSEIQSGFGSVVSQSHLPMNTTCEVNKKRFLVANVKLKGDWSEYRELLNLQNIADLQESKCKSDELISGDHFSFIVVILSSTCLVEIGRVHASHYVYCLFDNDCTTNYAPTSTEIQFECSHGFHFQ